MKDLDESLFVDKEENNTEVNFTNAKGFYQYLTKNIELISEFRLLKDKEMWYKALDCMFVTTFTYWKDKEDVDKYELLYSEVGVLLNKSDGNSNNIRAAYNNKINKLLREMNVLISKNTAHIMIKMNQPDEDDSKTWRDIFGETS